MSTKSQISTETPSPTVPKPSHFPTTGLAFVVVIATIANIAANWLIAQESKISDRENTSSVARAIEKSNESATIQFGNTENFELYKKVQALKAPEINKQIQAELSKAQWGAGAPAPTDPGAPQAMKKLTDEQYKSLFASTYIEGKAGAKLTVAEFSDFECPWCIRHYSAGTVKSLLTEYATSVNFTFHPIVLANHPNAVPKSYAAFCAGKYAGAVAFSAFVKSVFTESASEIVGLDKLPILAAAARVDAAKFKKCYDSQETKTVFDATRALSDSLGINWTPSTIIVNNVTKEYMTVSGAAPTADFKRTIDIMLK